MRGVVAWFARNTVAANLLMWTIIAAGVLTMPTLTQQMFPDVDVDTVSVVVPYLGAAPEEVESGVCTRVEEAIDGTEGVKDLFATASEGACVVRAELLEGADLAKALDDVKNRVDAIDTFPEEAEKPVISANDPLRSVIDVVIAGRADERTLKRLGERIRDGIVSLPSVTQAELINVRPDEISVEVSEAALRRHGLTFDDVARSVRTSSLDVPGGSLKTEGGEILLRTQGQAYRGAEFERILALQRPDGTRVPLGEIARVRDDFRDVDQYATFDGLPSAMVRVYRVGDQDGIEIANTVMDYVERVRESMPEGVELVVWRDNIESLRDRIGILFRNGGLGFGLVLVVLALFLRPRVAGWVSLGIPISLLGAIVLMPATGMTINVLTTFAFILVLGILVDDAVVVGESVYSRQRGGAAPLEASVEGTSDVTVPVIFGVSTTVCAFLPLMFSGGNTGQMFGSMGVIVICALLFSLVECLLILPAHLAHVRAERADDRSGGAMARWQRFQDRISSGFERFANTTYRGAVETCLRWRYTAAAAALCLLLWTLGTIAGGWMRFTFFPFIEANYVSALLTLPAGTPIETTEAALRRLEAAGQRLREQIDGEFAEDGRSLVKHVMVSVGDQPTSVAQRSQPGRGVDAAEFSNSHLGEVTLELIPSEERAIRTREVAQRWREITGPIPDAVELIFTASLFDLGDALSIRLRGPDVDQLREAAARLKRALTAFPGALDITDSFRGGKQELKLDILPSAEALGLTRADLGRQVRQAFYGEQAQRIQRGRDDIRVMVRYPESERRSLGDLENMRIRAADGVEVPFGNVARAEHGRGFSNIQRANRQRVIDVSADVDENVSTPNEIVAALQAGVLPELLADYPGLTYSLEGEQREQLESLGDLGRNFGLALFGIYALLAIPLRSYLQPLIIMSVIPFGLVGAIGGHLLMGQSLSFLSLMGVIAASGVVVNSSLILMHRTNQLRAQGLAPFEAVRDAAISRVRPIVLTSLTTFAGLTPLLLNRSFTAQFLIPMATSLAFGVLISTFITLYVTPSAYLILEDLRQRLGKLVGRRRNPAHQT
ncbi:MAG: efflux RND transporter permease subunit [Proteobacteria bacterium]|nr:efflux RND transporter permease subunit [Pseudomonadota bacterium]